MTGFAIAEAAPFDPHCDRQCQSKPQRASDVSEICFPSISSQYWRVQHDVPHRFVSPPYLADVDTVVDRPRRLETLHHALLKSFGQPVHPDKVLQVLGPGLVEGAA